VIVDDVPSRALAIFAHPDDPEIACAGTLARWSTHGCAVHLIVANAGEKGAAPPKTGPDALGALRAREADAAAAVMGLAGHELLGIADGELENTAALRALLVGRIRSLRPQVVIAPDPTAVFFGGSYINHRDHRELGWAVIDACAPAAGNASYFPDAGPAHQIEALLLAGTLEPDAWIDIEQEIPVKVAAVRCHATQLGGDPEVVERVVSDRAAEAGAGTGVRYAEGFRRIVLV
jgi:LmbE family N-acetylglucosaminyl deacetylase